jgi:glycosyltransferase involved in cell wall biosynthesis
MRELLEALNVAISRDAKIRGILVGSNPGFDETHLVEKWMQQCPRLRGRVTLLPSCSPENLWENLCATDIYAFPSHNEGMPNSLLEAMVMEVPAVAFAIPAVQEIEAGTGAVALVPPLDSKLFGETLLRLASSPNDRNLIGKKGKCVVSDRFMVQKNVAEALRKLSLVVEKWDYDVRRSRISANLGIGKQGRTGG